jgi:hypothetical protein
MFCATLDVGLTKDFVMAQKASDFRQHYIFGPQLLQGEHHWLLDWGPSRDVLKAAFRKRNPHLLVPYFARGSEFDFELDLLIDGLGLRSLPLPASDLQRCRLSFMFLKMLLRIEFQSRSVAKP